jgi:hypothetical protein
VNIVVAAPLRTARLSAMPSAMRALAVRLCLLSVMLAAACSPGTGPSAAAPTPSPSGSRPSSPATIRIVQPAAGASLTGTSVHVVLSLEGAEIVSATTTNIRPDQGHVHLYVNNVLVSMNYGLEQDVAVAPGTYVVKAEFVAADHAPFSPRVWSPEAFFTVR